jgi:hypothetical protein
MTKAPQTKSSICASTPCTIVASLLLALCAATTQAAPPTGRGLNPSPDFDENFTVPFSPGNAPAAFLSKWRFRTDYRVTYAENPDRTIPQCTNVASAVSVLASAGGANGVLAIQGNTGSFPRTLSNGLSFTFPSSGGGIISNQKFGYGYYEIRAKLPSKTGWHSSFWQMGADNEIDGFEVDSSRPKQLNYNCHYYKPYLNWGHHLSHGTGIKYMLSGYDAQESTADGYLTYGYEWTPNEVIFYLPDRVTGKMERIKSIDYPGPHSDQPMWLTMLGWTPFGEARQDDAFMYVDYFRFYAKDYGINPDAGKVVMPSLSGTWYDSTLSFGYAEDPTKPGFHKTTASSSSADGATATWRYTIPSGAGGNYQLFAWNPSVYDGTQASTPVPATGSNRSAIYKVRIAGGATVNSAPINQEYDGQQWVSIGAYKFNAGDNATVTHTVPAYSTKSSRVDGMMFRHLDLVDDDFQADTLADWTWASGPTNAWVRSVVDGGNTVLRTYKNEETILRRDLAPWHNYFVRADVKLPWQNSSIGLLIRYVNRDNFYMLRLDRATDMIYLIKKESGAWTHLSSAPVGADISSDWYELIIVANGNKLRGLFNGIEYVAAVDNTFSEGTTGVRSFGGEALVDKFGAGH